MLIDTELVVQNKSVYVSDTIEGFDYHIILNDKDNKPLNGKKVKFSFNGNNYTAVTDSEGIASVRLKENKAGSYNVNVIFEGDEYYSPASKNAKIEVIKQSIEIITPKYITYSTTEFKYYAMLKTSSGKALSNAKVTVTFNGKKYHTYTDENGFLTVSLKADETGTYGIRLEFEGNDLYESISEYKYIKIVKKSENAPISYESALSKYNDEIIKEPIKTEENKSSETTFKETNANSAAPSNAYGLAPYIILTVVTLGIIAFVIKRRNQ